MTCKQCGECCYFHKGLPDEIRCWHLKDIGNITFCDIYPFRPKTCKEWKCKK